MSTLSCPEEVILAEKITELHDWIDMVNLLELVVKPMLLQ